jgi:hypothetical protein
LKELSYTIEIKEFPFLNYKHRRFFRDCVLIRNTTKEFLDTYDTIQFSQNATIDSTCFATTDTIPELFLENMKERFGVEIENEEKPYCYIHIPHPVHYWSPLLAADVLVAVSFSVLCFFSFRMLSYWF